jgi:hypothetical protein
MKSCVAFDVIDVAHLRFHVPDTTPPGIYLQLLVAEVC